MSVEAAGWAVSFRLPTESDVEAARMARGDGARDTLLRRVVAECRHGSEEASVTQLPPEVTELIGARLSDSDPLATLDFELRCASCGHVWTSVLLVEEFLFARLDAWARRLLHDVHSLATAYGWSERAILEMSPVKRQRYLDMVAQ